MVEFGLKLEDNKVAEWQDKYIDYEGLKKLIKNAKKAYNTRQELENRNPTLAAEIKARLFDSNSSLNKIVERGDEDGDQEDILPFTVPAKHAEGNEGEKTMLLVDKIPSKYGSHESFRSQTDSNNSLGYFFKGVKKGIIFSYENKLRDAIEEESLLLDKFSIAIYQEVSKVNGFYRGLAEEMEERLAFLLEEAGPSYKFSKKKRQPLADMRRKLRMSVRLSTTGSNVSSSLPSSNEFDSDDDEFGQGQSTIQKDKSKEADSIKRAITDMHRRVKLLSNYAIINSTGFVKIVKKFLKQFPHKKDEYKQIKEGFICGEGARVDTLSSKMEQHYATWFCGGNETEARSLLLPKKGDGLDMDWSQLRLGYRLGMCSILSIWVAWDCIWGYVKDGHSTIGGRTAFPVFRACGGLLLVHWFWGFSSYVWNRYRINYIFLFDFDPRIVATPITIFENATDETLVFLMLMLLYYKSGAHGIPEIMPSGCYPFLLVLYTIKCLIFPLKTRRPLWRAIFAVITAPLTSPTFFHTYIADVMTSMVKVLQDILWTGCFVVSGDFLLSESDPRELQTQIWARSVWYRNIVIPLICLFPLWIRFNQCLRRYMDTRKRMPNLANAFKYALSQTVTLFGAFHPLYLMHKHHRNISKILSLTNLIVHRIICLTYSGFVCLLLHRFILTVGTSTSIGVLADQRTDSLDRG